MLQICSCMCGVHLVITRTVESCSHEYAWWPPGAARLRTQDAAGPAAVQSPLQQLQDSKIRNLQSCLLGAPGDHAHGGVLLHVQVHGGHQELRGCEGGMLRALQLCSRCSSSRRSSPRHHACIIQGLGNSRCHKSVYFRAHESQLAEQEQTVHAASY